MRADADKETLALRCTLVHSIEGRLRLRVAPERGNGHLPVCVADDLRQWPGIQHVHLGATRQSITLTYDSRRWDEGSLISLVHDVLGTEVATNGHEENGLSPSKGRNGSKPNAELRGRSSTDERDEGVEAGEVVLRLNCEALHAIPGRIRVRLERHAMLRQLMPALEQFLSDQSGISGVRFNANCWSIVIHHDLQRWDPDRLLRLLRGICVSDLRPRLNGAAPPRKPPSGPSWLPLAVSTSAIAATFVSASPLVSFLVLTAAAPLVRRALNVVCTKRRLNVDVLDAAATTVLLARGQFHAASVMLWLISLGDLIRDVTMQKSERAIRDVFDAEAQTAWLVRDGRKQRIKVSEIRPGDELVVYTGEMIPADGTVNDGAAAVDQSFLTGESLPIEKAAGDQVFAGTVVRDGKLYIEAEQTGASTMAAKIVQMVEQAPARETRIQNYAERFADRVVPWSFLGAGACVLATGNTNAAAAVLIADYGTGIRIAAPTTVLSTMASAARQGILFKGGGRFLEVLRPGR